MQLTTYAVQLLTFLLTVTTMDDSCISIACLPCSQHPTARTQEIKQAYYNLMRQHHPDQASNDGFDSNSFCALLNQIYQVRQVPHAWPAMLIASRSCVVFQQQQWWCWEVFGSSSGSVLGMYVTPQGISSTPASSHTPDSSRTHAQPNTLTPHHNPPQCSADSV